MKTFQVQHPRDQFTAVKADHMYVESGALVFIQGDDIALILAPSEWITVHDDEAGKKALNEEEQKKQDVPVQDEKKGLTLGQQLAASLIQAILGDER